MASDSESNFEIDILTMSLIHISEQQLQKLEELFTECNYPDKKLREKWGLEIGMDPDEIKYWFNTKLFNLKIEKEREENDALRQENIRISFENIQMSNKLKSPCTCSKNQTLGDLIYENAKLRQEHARVTNLVHGIFNNRALLRFLGHQNGDRLNVEENKGHDIDLELRLAPSRLNTGEIKSPEVDLELKLAPSRRIT